MVNSTLIFLNCGILLTTALTALLRLQFQMATHSIFARALMALVGGAALAAAVEGIYFAQPAAWFTILFHAALCGWLLYRAPFPMVRSLWDRPSSSTSMILRL